LFKGVVIRVKDFSQKADKQIKGFVGRFVAIASHVKKMLLKTPADPVARKSNGVFCFWPGEKENKLRRSISSQLNGR